MEVKEDEGFGNEEVTKKTKTKKTKKTGLFTGLLDDPMNKPQKKKSTKTKKKSTKNTSEADSEQLLGPDLNLHTNDESLPVKKKKKKTKKEVDETNPLMQTTQQDAPNQVNINSETNDMIPEEVHEDSRNIIEEAPSNEEYDKQDSHYKNVADAVPQNVILEENHEQNITNEVENINGQAHNDYNQYNEDILDQLEQNVYDNTQENEQNVVLEVTDNRLEVVVETTNTAEVVEADAKKKKSKKVKKKNVESKQNAEPEDDSKAQENVPKEPKKVAQDDQKVDVEKLTSDKANLVFKNVKSPEYAHTIARVLETLGNLKGNLNVYVYVSDEQNAEAPAINIANKIRDLLDSLPNENTNNGQDNNLNNQVEQNQD